MTTDNKPIEQPKQKVVYQARLHHPSTDWDHRCTDLLHRPRRHSGWAYWDSSKLFFGAMLVYDY
jgi:hypothetical protein